MSLATDIADDYEDFDWTETVTFQARNPTGTADSTVTALRRVLSRRDLAFDNGVGLQPDDLVFILFSATLGSNAPKSGDIITDSSGQVYTILSVEKGTLGSKWRCVCRKRD